MVAAVQFGSSLVKTNVAVPSVLPEKPRNKFFIEASKYDASNDKSLKMEDFFLLTKSDLCLSNKQLL